MKYFFVEKETGVRVCVRAYRDFSGRFYRDEWKVIHRVINRYYPQVLWAYNTTGTGQATKVMGCFIVQQVSDD
jgi:hypothetical protein